MTSGTSIVLVVLSSCGVHWRDAYIRRESVPTESGKCRDGRSRLIIHVQCNMLQLMNFQGRLNDEVGHVWISI